MAITTYGGLELSLERSLKRAPSTFGPAYQWFIEHEGVIGPRPYGDIQGIDIKLTAQRGIHKPGGYSYAVSIASTSSDTYSSDHLNELDDGTWVLQYCAHRRNSGQKAGSPVYNQSLLHCLKDGLPVGVFMEERGGQHKCLGLAFVERYNSQTDMFWLHGPVRREDGVDSFSPVSPEEQRRLIKAWDDSASPQDWLSEIAGENIDLSDEDERRRVSAKVIRRQQQSVFRKTLLNAYQGRCAITQFDAEPALQAAHICSYLGRKSQLTSNGLLLRADLHILYDRQLLGIDADYRVHIGTPIQSSKYAPLDGSILHLPKDKELWPSVKRLEAQFSDFRRAEADFAAQILPIE